MRLTSLRLRLDGRGLLEVVDPGFDTLALLQDVQPDFSIQQSCLDVQTPLFLQARGIGGGIALDALSNDADEELLGVHDAIISRLRRSESISAPARGEATLLELKRELARRVLMRCRLCAHRCGVDRTRGELGICRLTTEATIAEHFVHIAEEPPINPSLVLNLAGCGMRCRYCQQSALLDPMAVDGDVLVPELWSQLDTHGARTLSFVGGNPDESLYAILGFLQGAPAGWQLPIVWNCHAYSTPETLGLLDRVVDVYMPDFKYSSDACGRRWSATPDYPRTAQQAIATMVDQKATVIVRMLILPGHFECCHAPALDFLASLPKGRLRLSVRGQYCPDWRIVASDGAMARRPSDAEVDAVREKAVSVGLALVA